MDWTISIVTFILGTIIGYFICRFQINNGENSGAQQAKYQQLEAELAQYKTDVEQHFSGSANLLNQMANDYSKIYQHMVQSQQTLLPDSKPAIAALSAEHKVLAADPDNEIDPLAAAPQNSASDSPLQQPNDYVQGSHGIINRPPKEQAAATKDP